MFSNLFSVMRVINIKHCKKASHAINHKLFTYVSKKYSEKRWKVHERLNFNFSFNDIYPIDKKYIFLSVSDKESWHSEYHQYGGGREAEVVERSRIFDVLHSHVSRFGKYLAISIYCVRKWWGSFSHTIHYRIICYWKTCVLFGNDIGAIY